MPGGPYVLPWTFDTGIFTPTNGAPVAVPATPGGAALGDSVEVLVPFITITNGDSAPKLLTITDGAGNNVWPAMQIPPGDPIEREYPFMPLTGLHVGIDDNTLCTVHIWGWLKTT